jgi:hypothetical protein
MFVRYRHPYTYTVLQSVRTPAGPRQRCIAHWSGTPSLAEAITQTRKWLADHERTLADYRRAAGGATVGVNWFIRQVAPFQSCPKLEES